MYTEDDFIQLSALQHYVFCPRQCALIHVEDVWRENLFTVRGSILHEKVDTDSCETRGTVKTVRGLRIHSFRLGITGRCDVVEFCHVKEGYLQQRASSVEGNLHYGEVLPVEFKSGQPKDDLSDKVQLCAQVFCLEEMLNTTIKDGAFFYGRIRRRVRVEITDDLRRQTEETIAAVREIVSGTVVPSVRYTEKCKHCSLEVVCQPRAMNERKLASYMKNLYLP